MGVLLQCLLSFALLSLPQDPARQAAGARPAPAVEAGAADQAPDSATAGSQDDAELATLHALEKAGKDADLDAIERLTRSPDLAIARRATWLLGRHPASQRAELLRDLARDSRDGEIRTLALTALQKSIDDKVAAVAADRLVDADPRVRIAAAQLLGRVRTDAAQDALLAFVQRTAQAATATTDSRDLTAALVALHDLAASRHLLPVAEAMRGTAVTGGGQALAFYWQGLSPQLPAEQETTLLRAVLDHSEPLLRRHAISRLGELDCTAAVSALEQRLGVEGPELEPLVAATLRYLRRDTLADEADEVARAKANLAALYGKAETTWHGLGRDGQLVVLGSAAGAALLLLVVAVVVQRRRRAAAHAAAASAAVALTQPSLPDVGDYDDGAYEDAIDEAIDEQYDDEPVGAGHAHVGRR
jgi:HEAT repeat protein